MSKIGILTTVALFCSFGTAGLPLRAASQQAADAPAPQRLRVGGNVAAANILQQQRPVYPPEAKAARIEGTVSLGALIGLDGHIASLNVISGPPELVPSALEAVKQWIYKPTLLNGNPVEVLTTIDVNYTLAQ